MNRKLSLDKWIVVIAVLSLSAGAAIYVKNEYFGAGSKTSRNDGVGQIVTRVNDVRRKSEEDLAWNQIPTQDDVFNRDHIFTGDKSQAEIALKNGAVLSMNANSLIVIDDGRRKSEVKLEVGSFLGKLHKGESLRVNRNGKTIELKGMGDDTNVEVHQVKEGDFSITVLKGEMAMEQAGTTTELKQNQAVVFTPNQEPAAPVHVINYPVVLESPAGGDSLWHEANVKTDLRWNRIPDAVKYEIEVSSQQDFSDVISKSTVADSNLQVALPEGNAFWRVRAIREAGEPAVSPVSPFSNFINTAPVLESPKESQVVEMASGGSPNAVTDLPFKWSYQKPFDHYELEIARDPQFTQTVLKKQLNVADATLELTEPGDYYWRVQAPHRTNPNARWSAPQKFTLHKNEVSLPVETRLPAQVEASPSPVPSPSPEPVALAPAVVTEVATPAPAPTPRPTSTPDSTATPRPKTPVAAIESTSASDDEEEPAPRPRARRAPKPQPTPVATPIAVVATPPPVVCPVVPATPPLSLAKNPGPSMWLWLGIGENYQYYEQTIPTLSGDSKFQNISGPTLLARGGFQGQRWGADLSYKDTPGSMSSSDSVTVVNGKYHWQTLSSEVLYRLAPDSTFNFRLGFQQHSIPFMHLDPQTSVIEVKKNSLTMATAGFDQSYHLLPKTRLEWLMRYQYPILSGASDGATFKVTPQFAFDGSIGAVYLFDGSTRLGVYWYGQWHQYHFSYTPSGESSTQGQQALFYSNVELRLGFEF